MVIGWAEFPNASSRKRTEEMRKMATMEVRAERERVGGEEGRRRESFVTWRLMAGRQVLRVM